MPSIIGARATTAKNSRKADEEALASLLENIGHDMSLQPIYFQNGDDEFVLAVIAYGNSVEGLEFEYNNGNGTATGDAEDYECHR